MLYEVEFEIGITLLRLLHGRIPEMIEVDILDAPIDTVAKPAIDKPRSRLKRIGFPARESDEVDALLFGIVVHREPRNRSVSAIAYIAAHGTYFYTGHSSVVLDIVGFEKVLDLRFLESIGKNFSVHELYTDLGRVVRKKFPPGASGSFVPFFIVFVILYVYETRSGEVAGDGEFFPSLGNVGPTKRYPYGHSTDKSVGFQELLRRLYVDALKFHELHIFPENPFHPTKTIAPIERDGVYVAMVSQIPVIYGRGRPVVGMVFRKFGTFDGLHSFFWEIGIRTRRV